MSRPIQIADLFCGAGGTSTGALDAARSLGYQPHLTAVNHWPRAVETHGANHPEARHLCASVDSLNPRALFAEGQLDILWASPECTHHSRARGGASDAGPVPGDRLVRHPMGRRAPARWDLRRERPRVRGVGAVELPGQTARELVTASGGRLNERDLRMLASASDNIISGQRGYRHIGRATAEEIHHAATWLESQASSMTERATRIRRQAHRIIG